MSDEKIESDCPECGTQNLFFDRDNVSCLQCDKIIFTPASKEEALDAIQKWLDGIQKD